MSLFDQRMSAGPTAQLMHHNADQITYTPAGGQPVALQGIIGYEATSEEFSTSDGKRHKRVRDVTVVKVTGTAAQPVSGSYPYGGIPEGDLASTICIDDVSYAIDSVISLSGSFIRLALARTAVAEKSRPGMRRRP